ncbi:MAG: SIR2 family protein [Candidatus Hydrogenedentes bacterium]|nr:SIR2 family protein [Candidatus Hydrogenedentota bacterium]
MAKAEGGAVPAATVPADGVAVLRKAPFADHVGQITKLLSQSKRAFVIGAGCSKCAGLPLMEELTNKVLEALDTKGKAHAILAGLQKHFDGAKGCTIEDYMSELVDHVAIARRRKLRSAKAASASIDGTEYNPDDLGKALIEIKNTIAKVIGEAKPNIAVHRQFVRAIHQVLQSGKAGQPSPVDYYTLNYDTLFEDALSLERIPASDGFSGGATGWWDASVYKNGSAQARILKVHGSIDWCLWEGDVLPRRVRHGLDVGGTREPVLIWPASTKYREAQRDPFAQIIEAMRRGLRPSSETQVVLTICGYSFGDAHVNVELDRALHESNGRLTIMAFTNEDEPKGLLKKWRDDITVCDQVRIHANRGFFHGKAEERADVDLPWWRFEMLTRLLGGER